MSNFNPKKKSFFIILCVITISTNVIYGQSQNLTSSRCLESNKLIMKTLDKDNTLYHPLEQNVTGNGINFPWMAKMKSLHIRNSAALIDYEIRNQEIKLTLNKIDFFENYYEYESKIQLKLSDSQNLLEELRMPFFMQAMKLFENIKIKKNSCGSLYLNLLDDACLPILNAIPSVEECTGK